MIPVIARQNRRIAVDNITGNYILYDRFTTDRAAGAVNGTSAEPIGAVRTVADASSKVTISGGRINFASGAPTSTRMRYDLQARVLGKTLLANVSVSSIFFAVGWDNDTSGALYDAIDFNSSLNVLVNGTGIAVGAAASSTVYQIAISMRSTGMWYFIKGGVYSNWTLLYISALSNVGEYASTRVFGGTAVYTITNFRIPNAVYIPVPLQSDGMSSTTTDGSGNAEANGPTGTAYTNIGTWGVAGGVRSCSSLSGGIGISYLTSTSADVFVDAVCTRTAGNTGIVSRYVDANNYLIAYHDGTNAKLDQVVAGTTTNLISAAATYSATAVLRLMVDGTTARLFYNNAAVGAAVTVPSSTSLNHGLYTTDTGATFDNLVIWARGNGNEYLTLDSR